MINIRKTLAGAGGALFVALGLLLPQAATAAPASAPSASIEVNPASLKPPAKPPTVTKANTVKAKTLTGKIPHKVPNAGGVTTQTVTACAAPPCYFYAGGKHDFTAPTAPTGVYGNKMIDWSYTDYYARDSGAHNVGELAVIRKRASGLRDIVEVGTVSDRAMSPTGNDEPHFFVFAWVNGAPYGAYNSGFVNYTGANNCTYHPGDNMGAINGTSLAMGIEFVNTPGTAVGWWASNGGKWCGYFPADPAATSVAGNLWYGSGANFGSATQIQAFGEVASSLNQPCTDMGNGTQGTASTTGTYNYNTMPTYWSTVSEVGATTTLTLFNIPAGPPYDVKFLTGSVRSIFEGGTGWDSWGNLPGTRGNC